jgi:hypothetical protein
MQLSEDRWNAFGIITDVNWIDNIFTTLYAYFYSYLELLAISIKEYENYYR